MNDSGVEVCIQRNSQMLYPSQPNTVFIVIHTQSDEIFVNPSTGDRTRVYDTLSPPFSIRVNLLSSSHQQIRSFLSNRLNINHHWLCDYLASFISTDAINLGFGYNGFIMNMVVTVTCKTTIFLAHDVVRSLPVVQLGTMRAEELKSLNMETESCSICLENLSGSQPGVLTRMPCSHVFHSECLSEWLDRKNTCPLCRTVLYDR